ncbi:hypothetical protein RUM43_006176 [Polyplax serrata]|uniref:Uncharacterized protein n=1 Tax=Polyplax serrata TaxID=468196 RepID=A0AAN8NRJ4_POLSC
MNTLGKIFRLKNAERVWKSNFECNIKAEKTGKRLKKQQQFTNKNGFEASKNCSQRRRITTHTSGDVAACLTDIPKDCIPFELGGTLDSTLDELNEVSRLKPSSQEFREHFAFEMVIYNRAIAPLRRTQITNEIVLKTTGKKLHHDDGCNQATYRNIVAMKTWFRENEKLKSDESKRDGDLRENLLFGCNGTFRALEID